MWESVSVMVAVSICDFFVCVYEEWIGGWGCGRGPSCIRIELFVFLFFI